MKRLKFVLVFLVGVLFQFCSETSLSPENKNIIKLKLSYEEKQNDSTYNAIFKGTLYGQVDTMKMKVPEMFLRGTSGRTFIRYQLPDTFALAKSEYVIEKNLSPGTYNVFMMLQCLNNTDIYSDTLHITIQ